MTVSEARQAILEFTEFYFKNATVKFANQSFSVKPIKPLVNISFGKISRTLNPPWTIIDGRPMSYYPTTMAVTIDLYTNGNKLEFGDGMTPVYENTAAEDLMFYASFLNSDYVIQKCHNLDLAIVVSDDVQDLTELVNDTNYEFRARLELEMRFTTIALGYSGFLTEDCITEENTVEPALTETPSGGSGNEAILDDENAYFTDAEINGERMLNPTDETENEDGTVTDEDSASNSSE